VISSLAKRLEKPHFCHTLHFLCCMTQRSLHVVTKVYYMSMSRSAKVSSTKGPSCTMWVRRFRKYVTEYDANTHSTEQGTLPIVYLISKQVIPYQTCGGTCCPRMSTPKIRSLEDSSTTCHDGINHLHHAKHYSNHNIDPHMVISHLNGWKTTTLSQ
jgi:hypothetical protein